MTLLLFLFGCNPEHNEEDLGRIGTLENDLRAARTALTASEGAIAASREREADLIDQVAALQVVGQWYATANGWGEPAELVICHQAPMPSEPEPGQAVPAERQPWVELPSAELGRQGSDCAESELVTIREVRPEPEPEEDPTASATPNAARREFPMPQ